MDQGPDRRGGSWQLVREELARVFDGLDLDQYDAMVARFAGSEGRIFFTGQGRSGLAARMGAMRFMHLGYATHVVGETTAPSIRRGDTLVVVSGSGSTPVSVGFASIARNEAAAVVLVTHQQRSPLRELSDDTVVLPAHGSEQFGGTLFEQSALILLDAVVDELLRDLPDGRDRMSFNHTNLQ